MNEEIREAKKDIYLAYKNELEKKRRPEQVKSFLEKAKLKDHLVEKLAINLIEKNLNLQIPDFVNCQFFALNYMPYLPKIEHITSDKSFERWEKYKDWYKKKISKENLKKLRKKQGKENSLEYLRELLELKNLKDYEEEDKKLFHNTVRGFDLCLTSTSLYNRKSEFCRTCVFKTKCIKILKIKYLPLYKLRKGLIKDNTFLKTMKKIECDF